MSRVAVVSLLVVWGCERAPSPYDHAGATRPSTADASVDRSNAIAKGDGPTKMVVTATDIVWLDEVAGRVMKVSKSDGDVVELAHDQERPLGLAVDADHVFWTTRTGVWSVQLSGGELTALATNRASPDAIAVDDTSVYFAEQGLSRMSKTGGAVTNVHAGHPGGIVVDGDRLYWSARGGCRSPDGSIWSSPRGKLAPKKLAAKLRCPEGIATDRDSIYVADLEAGTILKISKKGGPPVVIVTDDSHGVRDVAVDSTTIYWANQFTGKVKRRLKAGGSIDTLFELKDPADVRVDDDYVYVTDRELGVVRRTSK